MATVLFKVFALTLKTAAKPLATRFEKAVMDHPVARQQIINVAQVGAVCAATDLCQPPPGRPLLFSCRSPPPR